MKIARLLAPVTVHLLVLIAHRVTAAQIVPQIAAMSRIALLTRVRAIAAQTRQTRRLRRQPLNLPGD